MSRRTFNPPLMVVAGVADVTPEAPVPLAGYSERRNVFDRVADNLEINAVLLEQAGISIFLYSADVLFITNEMSTEVALRLRQVSGKEARVIGVATHTHNAPSVDRSKPALGAVDPGYHAHFRRRLLDLAERLANSRLQLASMHVGSGHADHSVNRRLRGWAFSRRTLVRPAVVSAPNLAGPKDDTIRCIRIENHDGAPLCVVWSYACHPTACPASMSVSADFPGAVRRHLRAATSSRLPVLYMQGFSGDVRPSITGRPRNLRDRVFRGLNSGSFGEITHAEYSAWAASLALSVAESLANRRKVIALCVNLRETCVPLSSLIDGPVGDRQLRVSNLQLTSDLQLLFLSAEVVSTYGHWLCEEFGGRVIWPIGCSGSVFGYLPTQRILAEGGYEGGGFFPFFGLNGRFRPDVETVVKDRVRALIGQQ